MASSKPHDDAPDTSTAPPPSASGAPPSSAPGSAGATLPSFAERIDCPYCARELDDPDQGTLSNGLYEVRCACGAWLEILRHVVVLFRIRQCSPTVPPRVFLGE